MATVPIQTTPSVQLSTQGPGTVSEGPGIQPVQNFAPRQIQQFGATLSQAGNQLALIQKNLQDRYNDARTKQLYNNYSREVSDIETAFFQRQGIEALGENFSGTLNSLVELKKKYVESADDENIASMFSQKAQALENSATTSITRHSISQGQKYSLAEGTAEIRNNSEVAIRNWTDYKDPEGNFNKFTAAAIIQANQLADIRGLAADSYQRKQMVLGTTSAIISGVVFNMADANQYIQAKEFLDDAYNAGEIDSDKYRKLASALNRGVKRQEGTEAGISIWQGANAKIRESQGSFESAVHTVMMFEGGAKFIPDDAGRGATKGGINSKANGLSNEQVENLSMPEIMDIYKKKYWDALKIEKLPAEVRTLVFDAAVNQGQTATRTMIREATRKDGSFDRDKFIDLRMARYRKTVQSPRFAGNRDAYLKAWTSRIERIVKESPISKDQETGLPNLYQMNALVRNTVKDKYEQDVAINYITQRHNEAEAAIRQEYKNILIQAQDIAYARIGGYEDIPEEIWSQLKPPDQQKLMQGLNRGDDPNKVITILENIDNISLEDLKSYRPYLSEERYRRFFVQIQKYQANRANQQEHQGDNTRVLAATDPKAMLDATLIRIGGDLAELVNAVGDDNKNKRILILDTFIHRIDTRQEELGRKLTRKEAQEVLDTILTDTVKIQTGFLPFHGTQKIPTALEDLNNTEDYYVDVNVNGESERIRTADIPPRQVDRITDIWRRRHNDRFPTQEEIAQAWVDNGRMR